nr:unnamed protein product [Digitaria exilis]
MDACIWRGSLLLEVLARPPSVAASELSPHGQCALCSATVGREGAMEGVGVWKRVVGRRRRGRSTDDDEECMEGVRQAVAVGEGGADVDPAGRRRRGRWKWVVGRRRRCWLLGGRRGKL